MAKGDKNKHQAQMDTQQRAFQPGMTNLNNQLGNTTGKFMGNYDTGVGKNMDSYDQIMKNYQGFYDSPYGPGGSKGGGGYNRTTYNAPSIDYTDPFESYGGFKGFSESGGLSDADQQNMRERAIAPTRAIYQNAERNMGRQRALQGGYSPGFTAAQSRNSREMNQGITDANIAANSDIARMVQQGKEFGLSGMSGIEGQRLGAQFRKGEYNADANKWAQEGNAGENRYAWESGQEGDRYDQANRLAALRGMTDLYGTTPAMAQLFGNQVLQGQGQQLQGQQMQGDWGQNQIQNQYQNSQIPSNFQTTMGRIGTGLKYAGQIGAAIGTGGASLLAPGGGIYGPGGFKSPKVTSGLGGLNFGSGSYSPKPYYGGI